MPCYQMLPLVTRGYFMLLIVTACSFTSLPCLRRDVMILTDTDLLRTKEKIIRSDGIVFDIRCQYSRAYYHGQPDADAADADHI